MQFIKLYLLVFCCLLSAQLTAQQREAAVPGNATTVSESAKPWVFWYWMQAGVSKAGISADLKAMKEAGIGGAYLMPIKGAANPLLYTPAVRQLTPQWWEMMRHAFEESKKLGLQMGMHVSDGFALAGGPWITPELSMQKVVASKIIVQGGKELKLQLPQPESYKGYYKDIAVYAYPVKDAYRSTRTDVPKVTTSMQDKSREAEALIHTGGPVKDKESSVAAFRSDKPCWIMYEFKQPFTCRSIVIGTKSNNYQAQRLLIETSNDGKTFKSLGRLKSPRHGWQDTDAAVTHGLEAVTAKFFRFSYDPAGSEPGAEDLDAAKWKPTLKLTSLELSSAPVIHQYESKNGEVWRLSEHTTEQQLPKASCVPMKQLIRLKTDSTGKLDWKAPAGSWAIVRMGHTSTGHTNATGGDGAGLEVDKFNPDAIRLQFDSWYGEALRQAGPELAKEVLRVFHVDSWECGSQNWSRLFPSEFKTRRGYDLLPWLPVLQGIPLESAEKSEQVLYDVRETIAELVVETFYQTLANLAKEKGVKFSAESVAPTMMSDGLLHYKKVDLPMGEFWHNSPTHDKPNDMLDAISGAHIYGKNIVQAEAFTTVRMAWNEHPGMLKRLQDKNYALGINKLVYHVFTHNPWIDRKPGMTLDGVGLYFQRDQTWWKPGKAWVDYASRCQTLLQQGKPVTDIAVFTGEDYPRRALLPERLVQSLPGLFGAEAVAREEQRLANVGQPIAESPKGVFHSANIPDPLNWADPLRGYAYDSFNPDVLMQAVVKDGKVVFPSGANYAILVFPHTNPLDPSNGKLSTAVQDKIRELQGQGAKILVTAESGPYQEANFSNLGIAPDIVAIHENGKPFENLAWNHRSTGDQEIYFLSNQTDTLQQLSVSFRDGSDRVRLYNAIDNTYSEAKFLKSKDGRKLVPLRMEANGSLFVVFARGTRDSAVLRNWPELVKKSDLSKGWKVRFDAAYGGPAGDQFLKTLTSWSISTDSTIRYYSGTASYLKSIKLSERVDKKIWLDLGEIANLATITINGIEAGTVWTRPYRLEVSKLLRRGSNTIEIAVSNTWANRLIGDQRVPEEKRISRTTAPYRLSGADLEPAGLLGPVMLFEEK